MKKIIYEKDNNNDNQRKEKIGHQYKCEECGIDFGNSIGKMEEHKLTFHLQKGDIEIK